jgi:hypothetical protein
VTAMRRLHRRFFESEAGASAERETLATA